MLSICISCHPGNRNAMVTQLIIRFQLMFYLGIIQVIFFIFSLANEKAVCYLRLM